MGQGHSRSSIKNSDTAVPVYGLINWLALLELPLATICISTCISFTLCVAL